MTFATQRGTDGAPDSFLGTTGEDILLLQNQQTASFVSGRQDDDTVTVTSFQQLVSNQTLRGGAGNDTVNVQNATNFNASFISQDEGNDTITTNALTSSTVQGNAGNDVLTTQGLVTSSIVNGNQGNDTVTVAGQAAAGLIFGGIGFDNININSNSSSGTKFQGNEDADSITLAAGVDIQNSTINGNQGNDTIFLNDLGGFGVSTIFGGSGNDTVNAAAAAGDNLIIHSNDGNDTVITGTGNDTIVSSAGNDTINAAGGANSVTTAGGNTNVTTLAGNDTIAVGAGNDTVNSGNGVNTITAVAGNNALTAGTGTDNVAGGGGADTITGNAAADTMSGGAGSDQFAYVNIAGVLNDTGITLGTSDVIGDFTGTQGDTIQTGLAGTALNYDETGGAFADFALALAAANVSFAAAGAERYYLANITGGNGVLFITDDNDGTADSVIQLTGVTAANFAFGDITA